ncbi:hypothetical protein LTR36_004720 [Oleoguttula mirabilis]|uniref:non-specific serine/threonine protein kinase n=1 Tax=Oleoguttula mirabilis TaxID=1507867 RepID=A0AAV9JFR1_9PEZI|nr:hypothetical protein LTR36_004720 [Oleoguttula mirabilis]
MAARAFPKPDDLGKAAKDLGFGTQEGFDGHWNFLATIGEGKFGHAGLWVQYDAEARITNRTIIKEAYPKPAQWTNRREWYDMKGRLPKEVHIHRTLSRAPRAWAVAGFLGWSLSEERRMYRVYMPYYPHGDFGNLIWEHAKLEGARDENGEDVCPLIPASAIWCFFEALAAAACLMRDGALPGQQPPGDWEGEVVHMDIKPINVFLDTAHQDRWRTIPMAKLGDFGLAMYRNAPGIRNPDQMVGRGTVGYQAPEQVRQTGGEPYRFRVTSKSDVYSIGKSLLSLMDLQSGDRVQTYGYDDVPIPPRVRDFYPPGLVSLLEQCLEDEPTHRIVADDLLRAITDEVAVGLDGIDSTPLKFQSRSGNRPLRVKADIYEAFAK